MEEVKAKNSASIIDDSTANVLDAEKKVNNGGSLKYKVLVGIFFSSILLTISVLIHKTRVGKVPIGPNDASFSAETSGFHENMQKNHTPVYKLEGPFEATVELLNEGITDGYESQEELEEAIDNAAKFMFNMAYEKDTESQDKSTKTSFSKATLEEMISEQKKAGAKTTDYGTNNQEKGVEEDDIIVSDGEFVYAAYQKYLVVWNVVDGKMVKKVEMPPVEKDPTGWENFNYNAEPWIRSLLLNEGRLVVVVEGYQEALKNRDDDGTGHVLYSYLATHVRLYDTASMMSGISNADGLIGTADVNGSFNGIRAVDGNVHIVTGTEVDTYTAIYGPIDRNMGWRIRSFLSNFKFTKQAKESATTRLLNFRDKLIKELKAGQSDGNLPSLARINLWQTEISESGLEKLRDSDNLMNSLVLVHSFDVQENISGDLKYSSSGAFGPTSWVQVYASEDHIIISTQGYERFEAEQGLFGLRSRDIWTSTTVLVAVELEGATSKPKSIGKLFGSVLNPHSIDVLDNKLRVATTVMADKETEDLLGDNWASENESTTLNYVTILDMPIKGDGEAGEMQQCGRVRIGEPDESITAVRFFDNVAYAVTFVYWDPFYVLDLSDCSNPQVVSSLVIPGFSSYLHAINEDNSLILSIGQGADENDGSLLGIKLVLFDARNKANPVVLHEHEIYTNADQYVSSDSTWDFHATRFVDGYLYMPIEINEHSCSESIFTESEFVGFLIFKVDETGIEEMKDCRVPFQNATWETDWGCYDDYYDGYYDENESHGFLGFLFGNRRQDGLLPRVFGGGLLSGNRVDTNEFEGEAGGGGPMDSCSAQVECIVFTSEVHTEDSQCESESTEYKVCATLNLDNPDCVKSGTISHTCQKDANSCSSADGFEDAVEFNGIGDGYQQCQIATAGSAVEFLFKDGAGCSGEASTFPVGGNEITASCSPRSEAVRSCTGNGAGQECIWTVVLPEDVTTPSPTTPSQDTPSPTVGSTTSKPTDSYNENCEGFYDLPRRSFIFDGKLMAIDGNVIISTDLETCDQVWKRKICI